MPGLTDEIEPASASFSSQQDILALPIVLDESNLSSSYQLKKTYKPKWTIEPFYTGGRIDFDASKNILACPVGESVYLVNYENGNILHKLHGEADVVTCLAIEPSGQRLVFATRSLLLKTYDIESGQEIRSWKGHEAPVLSMAYDPTSSVLATGSADATIRVWDAEHGFCTHIFKGHRGIISCLQFHRQSGTSILFSGGEEGLVKVWDLQSKSCIATLDSHVSPVRGLDLTPDYKYLISGGRDKVFMIWNTTTWKLESTVPVYEFIEACGVISSDDGSRSLVYTAGEKGMVKLWDWKTGKMKHGMHIDGAHKQSIADMIYSKETQQLFAMSSDQNILVYDAGFPFTHPSQANLDSTAVTTDVEPLPRIKQMVGYNEEILQFAFLKNEPSSPAYLAVATNSEQIRIYDLNTRDCQVLYGHTEIALCVDTALDVMVSGSKDNTARVWKRVANEQGLDFQCVGVCIGHTEDVTAVALGKKTATCFITASSDRTIKSWDMKFNTASNTPHHLTSKYTFQAHDKEINSLTFSPNEKIFATASQDKTAKIWNTETGTLLGVCKGHKRGVWALNFSPVDQVLATSSGDKTIRIWSLKDYTCLKTFEGHLNSVLQVQFCSAGLQLVSAGADGLVKLWTVKTNECVGTFDEHEDKIWALSMSKNEKYVVSGGADSRLIVWEDMTQEEAEEAKHLEEKRIIDEQHLSNYIARKDYKKAIKLALKLDKPVYLLNLLEKVFKSVDGEEDIQVEAILESMIEELNDEQLEKLLVFTRDWNTSARKSEIAQTMLFVVLSKVPMDRLLELPKIKEILESLIPYTERHFNRSKKLMTDQYIVDYMMSNLSLI